MNPTPFHFLNLAASYRAMASLRTEDRPMHLDRARFYLRMARNARKVCLP